MAGDDEALADEEVIGVLRQQLPPQLQGVESVEELLEYGIAGAKAERDAAIDNFAGAASNSCRTSSSSANLKKEPVHTLMRGAGYCFRHACELCTPVANAEQTGQTNTRTHRPPVPRGDGARRGRGVFGPAPRVGAAVGVTRKHLSPRSSIDNLNVKVAKQRAQAFIIAETLSTMSAAETG
ncbi:uncharacterized protein BcabD6B2_38750 [Babesia caballi]|uniref:Uncharacterized protein n=1 Tax=Babesia caballi TaxID=5871 RepID=A0AAV4LXV3_BABCB|nr:hypothetical protein, conserved [Babesia caballi]